MGSSVAVVPGVRRATTVHSLSTRDRYGTIGPARTEAGDEVGTATATLGAGAAVLGPGPSADPSTGLAPGLDPGRPVGPQGCQTSTASVDAIARTAAVARLRPTGADALDLQLVVLSGVVYRIVHGAGDARSLSGPTQRAGTSISGSIPCCEQTTRLPDAM